MKTFLSKLGICLMYLTILGGLIAEQRHEYGQKGDFELSAGASTVATANDRFYKTFTLSLLPYANHFVFNRVFLRYALGTGFSAYEGPSWGINLEPGLGIGYSFVFSSKWVLNAAIGYSQNFNLYKEIGYPLRSTTQGYLNVLPELKYLITDKWIASILMRGDFTYYTYQGDLGDPTLSFTTRTYIVLSYLF